MYLVGMMEQTMADIRLLGKTLDLMRRTLMMNICDTIQTIRTSQQLGILAKILILILNSFQMAALPDFEGSDSHES